MYRFKYFKFTLLRMDVCVANCWLFSPASGQRVARQQSFKSIPRALRYSYGRSAVLSRSVNHRGLTSSFLSFNLHLLLTTCCRPLPLLTVRSSFHVDLRLLSLTPHQRRLFLRHAQSSGKHCSVLTMLWLSITFNRVNDCYFSGEC